MVTQVPLDATGGQRMDSLPGLQSSSFRAGPWLSPIVKKKSSRGTGAGAREGEESGLPVASQRNGTEVGAPTWLGAQAASCRLWFLIGASREGGLQV